jgi:hypothetical protein
MSNNWSIFLTDEGQGEIGLDDQTVNWTYKLTVWQVVLVPRLFTAECWIDVIHHNLSIVVALLNQVGNKLVLKLSDGETFEAETRSKGSNANMYCLGVTSINEVWIQRKQRSEK